MKSVQLCRTWRIRCLALPLMLPLIAPAQAVMTIQASQCEWHPGDAEGLSDRIWKPYSEWKLNPDQPQLWVRCDVHPEALPNEEHLAVQVRLYAAYELFVDGERIGGSGNLDNGNFSMDVMRTYPLPSSVLRGRPSTIALRITYRLFRLLPLGDLPGLQIRIGDAAVLRNERSSMVLAQSSIMLPSKLSFGITGVIAFVLAGLWFYDRADRQVLLLALQCIGIATIQLGYFCTAELVNYPAVAYQAIWAAGGLVVHLTRFPFFFAVAKRRVPVLIWALILVGIVPHATELMGLFCSPGVVLHLGRFVVQWLYPMSVVARIAASTTPFFLFLPLRRLAIRMQLLATSCIAFGVWLVFLYSFSFCSMYFSAVPFFQAPWGYAVNVAHTFCTLLVVIALMTLLFREQQQTAKERALLAGEMQAAREIQRMLAPGVVKCAPGVQIHVAFHPMRDVGGDFFLCPELPDGRQRVLLGDVSGKGSAAAMTAALLLGGAQARDGDSPAELLAHLNRVLRESRVGGFATCICADLRPDGALVLANAGHLAPYRNGVEVDMENGFPLGINPESEYVETALHLDPGDRLTLMSDGVVEARNKTGELFGFERTRKISGIDAEEIAAAARLYGQDDDITVLTLARAG